MGRGKSRFRPSQPPNKGEKIAPQPIPTEGSTNGQRPIFNLEHLGGDYCLSACTTEEKAAFADTIHRLSKLTWGEIHRAPRHGLGSEIIDRASMGKRTYPPDATEDVNMLAFRFHGKAPMVGYRIGRVFTVLFLDRDFTLYPHG
jgi:hypothetical protein